ncbi:glycosyltransferase family 2 protein [Streptococcaceae bacterium ESL0729]|nr:glycosyltransferase family 2 protein [Streptococcaceae bacterium ESL0729]
MKNDPKIASIIVTFNRKELLIEAVEAMKNQTLKPSNIIIIDNNSTDGTFEELEKNGLLGGNVIYKKLDENIGGAGGFSAGVKYALDNLEFDWLSLSDDDAIYDLNYFANLFSNEDEYSKYGGLCGKVQFPDGEVQMEQRRNVTNPNILLSEPVAPETKADIDLASFCGLVVNRDVVEKIGLPREDFFIWMDDTEYSLRIRKEAKILYNPLAFINHKTAKPAPASAGPTKLNWKNYYGYRNSLVTGWAHAENKMVFSLVNLKNYSKIIFGKLRRGDKDSAKVVFTSTVDAIRGNMGISEKYRP